MDYHHFVGYLKQNNTIYCKDIYLLVNSFWNDFSSYKFYDLIHNLGYLRLNFEFGSSITISDSLSIIHSDIPNFNRKTTVILFYEIFNM